MHHEAVAYYCVVLLVAIGMMKDILLSSRLVIEKRKELMTTAWHHSMVALRMRKKSQKNQGHLFVSDDRIQNIF